MRANQLFLKASQVQVRRQDTRSFWPVDADFPFVTVDWNDEGTLSVTFREAESE